MIGKPSRGYLPNIGELVWIMTPHTTFKSQVCSIFNYISPLHNGLPICDTKEGETTSAITKETPVNQNTSTESKEKT